MLRISVTFGSGPLVPTVMRVADLALSCCCSQSVKRGAMRIITGSSGHAPRGRRRFVGRTKNNCHVNLMSFLSEALLTMCSWPCTLNLTLSPFPSPPPNLRLGPGLVSPHDIAIAVVITRGSAFLTRCEGCSTASSPPQTLLASVPRFRRKSFNRVLVTKPTLVDSPRQWPVIL